jgi:hypothetical protein
MSRFERYEDSKKLRNKIRDLYYLGYGTKDIAKMVERPETTVSYHLKALGLLTRKRHRRDVSYCMVCGENPVDPVLSLVCRENGDCSYMYIRTFISCQMPAEEAKVYILTNVPFGILPSVPMDTAVVCVDGYHRVYLDKIDHLKYHIYRWQKAKGVRAHRPPTPLWLDKEEERKYKERLKEADYIRRNALSEHPQPKRIR